MPDPLGPGLPAIREWTEAHFDFSGYVTGFDPPDDRDGGCARELGYRPDEQVCVVTVGGSGVGGHLLRRAVAALPGRRAAGARPADGRRRRPADRPGVGAGRDGRRGARYVPDLYRHLAACDLAVVQGGLTTTMELTARRRPFLYVPLRNHFEQNFHVRHRLGAVRRRPVAGLGRDRAGRAGRGDRRPRSAGRSTTGRCATDGAARAAALLAELL